MITRIVLTTKYWHTKGVHLTVGFLDAAPADSEFVFHMNAWGKTANVRFVLTTGAAQVWIARVGGDQGGYWSHLGRDILQINADKPTMNSEAFAMTTLESQYRRAVRP